MRPVLPLLWLKEEYALQCLGMCRCGVGALKNERSEMFSATAKLSPTPNVIPKHKLQINLNPRNGHILAVGNSAAMQLLFSWSSSFLSACLSNLS